MVITISAKNTKEQIMNKIPHNKIGRYALEEIRKLQNIPIEVVEDKESLSDVFAAVVIGHITKANQAARPLTLIMPVGPTGQWEKILKTAIHDKINLSRLSIIQMDEYLTDDASGKLAIDNPFSFTRFVQDNFAAAASAQCGFKPENWIIPDPRRPELVSQAIEERGGVDVAFAGIGLNGHLAFNEPPEPGSAETDASFPEISTRIVRISSFTKATNSIFGTGGDLGSVPDFAVTIGMKQILEAKCVHVFLDWHWQRFVFRRTLLGAVSKDFPASFLQRHKNVHFTVTEEVAAIHPLIPE
jgi:glucosamine-6-phosphate deaminase